MRAAGAGPHTGRVAAMKGRSKGSRVPEHVGDVVLIEYRDGRWFFAIVEAVINGYSTRVKLLDSTVVFGTRWFEGFTMRLSAGVADTTFMVSASQAQPILAQRAFQRRLSETFTSKLAAVDILDGVRAELSRVAPSETPSLRRSTHPTNK